MSKVKLFVALQTTHGLMQDQFLPGVLDLFKDRTYDMHVRQYIDPYLVLGRNTAATDFLSTDCTHYLNIDTDMVFRALHARRLIEDDVDVVGGLYPKKAQGKIQWVCNALPHRPEPDERGLLPLKHVGTGFLMVKRAVFEKMVETDGDKIGYLEAEIDKPNYDFFQMPLVMVDGKRRKLSEDWYFCERAAQLGFTVYGDTKVILRHIGTVIFPLETQVVESRRQRVEEGISHAVIGDSKSIDEQSESLRKYGTPYNSDAA